MSPQSATAMQPVKGQASVIIPSEPMHHWKVAWESARKTAKVPCRFHDLRHTFISRLAESQASDSTVMALAGHVSRAMMGTLFAHPHGGTAQGCGHTQRGRF